MSEASKQDSTQPETVPVRIRRVPRISAFVATGVVLGMVAGILIDILGPDARCPHDAVNSCRAAYSPSVTLAFFAVLGATLGAALGATIAAVLDRMFTRG
ncbi:hypothetical protein [Austwickia sp. TVS 96-490-7B]|uniref:hypothetical protein n=1 Tax=Austwickia sp. TVS 96-490-7B TaxID=2830843 RepID=UPI001C56BAE9|nr:hypothetical protein [Austwickia sp. TVS 96-490-7B]